MLSKIQFFFVSVLAFFTSFFTIPAQAAGVDVSPLVQKISDNEASMNTVGMAILGLIVIVVIFMMIRRMMR